MDSTVARLTHLLRARLKMKQLVVLCAIAEEGSLHRAAAAHGMSQPALSKMLKEIEDVVDAPLFEREHSGIRLTRFGERLIFRARALLSDLDQTAVELSAIKDGYEASLRIGMIPLLSPGLLVKAMSILEEDGKKYTFQITIGSADALIDALRARTLDCALARFPAAGSAEDLDCRKLYTQNPFLVAHPKGILGHHLGPIKLSELSGCSWILPPHPTPIRAAVDRIFLMARQTPPVPAIECFDPTIIRTLLAVRPDLIAIMPQEIAEDIFSKDNLIFFPMETSFKFPDVCLINLRRRQKDPALGHFISALARAIQVRAK